MTSEELYQRYVWAGAMTRNADALADLFTADGVLESPLVPPGHHHSRRGRNAQGPARDHQPDEPDARKPSCSAL